MRFNIAKKILAGYLTGFMLLLAFAGLTLYNGMRIEATTQSLAQQKLPGLIAATGLKNGLQIQKTISTSSMPTPIVLLSTSVTVMTWKRCGSNCRKYANCRNSCHVRNPSELWSNASKCW